jgi:hypothetical protein
MYRFSKTAAVTLAALLVPAAVAAQDYRYSAGYNAGAVYFTNLNPSAPTIEGQAARDITLETTWVMGLQFEQWFGSGRLGARIEGAVTESNLEVPGRTPRDVGVWLADVSLLLRVLSADPENTVAPYIRGGVGLVGYGLGDGDVLNYLPAGAVYDGNDAARFSPIAGIGFDIMTGWRWDDEPIGFRIEATDHMALESPFRDFGTGERFGMIHNVRVTLGIFTGFGVLR